MSMRTVTKHTSRASLLLFRAGVVAWVVYGASLNYGHQSLAAHAQQGDAASFDLLIQNGRIIDGTGNPAVRADVGVRGDRIVAIGNLSGSAAARIIEARGLVVTPGFIDLHTHADDADEKSGLRHPDPVRRAAPNLVTQGITTVVVNPDGFSPWPLKVQRDRYVKDRIGPNAILLAGHNTIRQIVLGLDHRRPATAAEIDRMRALVAQGIEAGPSSADPLSDTPPQAPRPQGAFPICSDLSGQKVRVLVA